jgi:PKD repeat protein
VGPQAAATATHTYTDAGTFTVDVTVTDTAGLSSDATASVTVSLGPTNLVGNPGFETSVAGWNTSGRAGVTLTRVSGGHSGAWSALVANTNATTTPECTLNDSPNWAGSTSGGTYNASLWARADTAGAVLRLKIREYSGSTFVGQQASSITLSTTWTRIDVAYIPAVSGSNLDLNAVVANAAPGTCFYADDVSVVQS